MAVKMIIGLQYGDEGKGRAVHYEAKDASIVIRATGGSNAGHTVVANGKKYAMHLLPSAIIRPEVLSIIGPGVVADLQILTEEIQQMREAGVKVEKDNDQEILDICHEWEQRTRMELEYDYYTKIIQKDVNNYIIVAEDGHYKSKGACVKKLNELDNNLPIVNKAVVDYFIKGTPVEETILNCKDLKQFQQVVKVSNKYLYALYGDEILKEKCLRVFASIDEEDKGVFKLKAVGKNPEKIAGTPIHCFINNEDINSNNRISRKLDKQWYIDLANKRINDFKGCDDNVYEDTDDVW